LTKNKNVIQQPAFCSILSINVVTDFRVNMRHRNQRNEGLGTRENCQKGKLHRPTGIYNIFSNVMYFSSAISYTMMTLHHLKNYHVPMSNFLSPITSTPVFCVNCMLLRNPLHFKGKHY
jgi:hypothetical protein